MTEVDYSSVNVQKNSLLMLRFCPPDVEIDMLQTRRTAFLIHCRDKCWWLSTKVSGGPDKFWPIVQALESRLEKTNHNLCRGPPVLSFSGLTIPVFDGKLVRKTMLLGVR